MKTILTSLAASSLLAALAIAQPHYNVTDLGPANTAFGQATWVNDFGLVTGFYTALNGTQHAALWFNGEITDISKPGL